MANDKFVDMLSANAAGGDDNLPGRQRGKLSASFRGQTYMVLVLRCGLAAAAVAAGMGLRLMVTAWVGPGLPTYITFYPAVMVVALLAGLWAGLTTTALTGLVVASWLLPPVGHFDITSPVDRLGLGLFTGMGLLMSVVAELYRRDRRKAAEYDRKAAVRESQARLATFAEATFEGIVQTEAGRIVDCNEQFARMSGYAAAALTGMDIADLTAPEDRDRVMGSVRRGVDSLVEHAMIRKDGTRIVVEAHGQPLSSGSARRHTAVRDITERKRAEESLQHERDLLQAVMNGAKNSHLVYLDRDFNFVRVNETYAATCGYRPDEMIGKNHFTLYPDAENEAIFARVRDTGESAAYHDKPFEFPDQPRRGVTYWDWTLLPVRDPAGNVKGLVFSLYETTERKRAEEALRNSERLYRAIGESIDYGIWVCDPDGQNTYASESFLKLVGLTQEQCSSFGWGDVLHPDDAERTISAWKECVRTGGNWDIEHRFRGVDGRWHPVLARGVPVRNDRGEVFCWAGINLDITRLKQAEEALRAAKDELEQRVQERTAELSQTVNVLQDEMARRTLAEEVLRQRSEQLRALASELTLTEQRERRRLAEVLHDDLQQLLVGAKLRLEAMNRGADPDVKVAIRNVQELLDQSIECSRTLTGELSPPILHEAGLVAGLKWLAARMRQKHGLAVELHADEDAVPGSEDMAVLLFQSIKELLFNAVKHAKVNRACVRIGRVNDIIKVTVSDDGAGFDPQAARPKAGKAGRFGLFSIRERLDLLGGQMEIDSAPGRGSRFTLRVPLGAPVQAR